MEKMCGCLSDRPQLQEFGNQIQENNRKLIVFQSHLNSVYVKELLMTDEICSRSEKIFGQTFKIVHIVHR